MGDEVKRITRVRIGITHNDESENIVAKYLTNPKRSTRSLGMAPWIDYYLSSALIEERKSIEDVSAITVRSIAQLRAQIDRIIMEAEDYGIDLPMSAYGSDTSTKPTKAKSEKKPAKPKSPPKSKVEEDDDEDWEFDENDDSFIKTSLVGMNLPNKTI